MSDAKRLQYLFKYCKIDLRKPSETAINETYHEFLLAIDRKAEEFPDGLTYTSEALILVR